MNTDFTKNIDPARLLPGIKPALEIAAGQPQLADKIYCKMGKQGQQIEKLIALCQHAGIRLDFLPDAEFSVLCRHFHHTAHQGVITILKNCQPVSLDELLKKTPQAPLPLIIALDQVQDPGNLGAICRTAWCLGCAGILLPKHNSALAGPAAARASAGTIARLPLCILTNLARGLDMAEEAGFMIYGAGLQQTNPVNAFTFAWQLPAVLVLGSEQHGLRPGVAKRCHSLLTIPFSRPFDSLNVAQAGAILMALCARQK